METLGYAGTHTTFGSREGTFEDRSTGARSSFRPPKGNRSRERAHGSHEQDLRISVEYLEHTRQNSATNTKKRIRSTVASREEIAQLADAFRRGEVWAFRRAAEEFFAPITNFLVHLTRDQDTAQDLAQEAFFAAFRSHHTFRKGAPLAPWIFRIARNLAYKELNRRSKRPQSSFDELVGKDGFEPPSTTPTPHESSSEQDLRNRIDRALAKLKPKFRDAVILRLVQGYSGEEAASLLDVPVATLNTRVHRGIRQLRKTLKYEGITESTLGV